jgi:hypothetical protein
MTDITHYSDQELSLLFLNEEKLYRELMRAVRREKFDIIEHICDEHFVYTYAQLEDLRETFNDEVKDYDEN